MNKPNFNKIIVWGHKIQRTTMATNTFAFVHSAWEKTFKHLGCEVMWLDNQDNVSNVNFENCLFFTEGQVDNNIPVVKSSKYILHNCDYAKYADVLDNCLHIGPYPFMEAKRQKMEIVDKSGFVFYQPEPDENGCKHRTLHQPWATDLLPHEIDPNNPLANKYKRQKKVFWVGSICTGYDGNLNELNAFSTSCREGGVPFIHTKVENKLAARAVCESWLAPAVQGSIQVMNEYVPCRIFKNISYGRMPLTNCKKANELFGDKLVYSSDISKLYDLGVAWEANPNPETMKEIMIKIRDNHTYVNRVEKILEVL